MFPSKPNFFRLKKLGLDGNILCTIKINMMKSHFHVTKADKFRVSMVRFVTKFGRVIKTKVKNT